MKIEYTVYRPTIKPLKFEIR